MQDPLQDPNFKYRMLLPYLDRIYHEVWMLIPKEIKEEEIFIEDFVCLMIIRMLGEDFDSDLVPHNIDRVEQLTPQVREVMAEYKEAILEDSLDQDIEEEDLG